MQCIDCKIEIKGRFHLENACSSCEIIRQNTGRCWMCGAELVEDNMWFCKEDGKKENTCITCAKKFNELPDVEILCPSCFSPLEQDHENLYELWCPKCIENKMLLERI